MFDAEDIDADMMPNDAAGYVLSCLDGVLPKRFCWLWLHKYDTNLSIDYPGCCYLKWKVG